MCFRTYAKAAGPAASTLVLTSCDTHIGSSGGPVLTVSATGPSLNAIMIAAGLGGTGNIALSVEEWPNLPLTGDCP